jgi:hypothetical protein
MFRTVRNLLVFLFSVVSLFVLSSASAQAGGGPENVFLVVNPNSVDSMTVANHYIKMRDIPDRNVFYLEWDPKIGITNIDTFREKILQPILKEISDRGLIGQIDYVIYSVDYPWRVNLSQDTNRFIAATKKEQEEKGSTKPVQWPKTLTRAGSINGLTYLYQQVLTKQPVYTNLKANRYARIGHGNKPALPTIGFSNRLLLDASGNPTKETSGKNAGFQYLLSVCLGVTNKYDRRGNTVEEIIHYLNRSVQADATFPNGNIYFDDSNGIRNRVRKPFYKPAIQALSELGIKAEMADPCPPKDATNIMGLTFGAATKDIQRWQKEIQPGAICDNLTSFGGVMLKKIGQTPISDFMRFGMAGASGTVTEPYAIPPKFPNAMIYVHYARGCSLAEAFYQSVHGPYQLLIVGEPLCKPWAKIPKVLIRIRKQDPNAKTPFLTVRPNQVISGKQVLRPFSKHPGDEKAHHFEIYLDGHLIGICLWDGEIPFNTKLFSDGYHELRVVAVGPQPIYTRGYTIVPIRINNQKRAATGKATPSKTVLFGEPVTIKARCPGAKGIEIEQNGRIVAKIDGPTGEAEIDTNQLGKGPVSLQVFGVFGEGSKNRVPGRPISLEVN